MVSACQVQLIQQMKKQNEPQYYTDECIAYFTRLGDICLFNVTTGVQLLHFYAHDDIITDLAFCDGKLVSVSYD